jgi:GT2 family glycosyltransferase
MATSVSVIVVTHNEGPILLRCLESLAGEADGKLEVVLVNNGETTPEISHARSMDFVRVVSPASNLGYAGGCNFGAKHASGSILFFLNPDTVVAPGTVGELARTLEDRSIGIVMPRLRLLHEPETLNSSGNVVHISGLAWSGGYGQRARDVEEVRDIPYPSGAAMALRAELFRELGGFTGEFFIYQEDLELGWRAHMRGLRVIVTPGADVYHDYRYGTKPSKFYLLERNRLIVVFSAFSLRLLLLLAPVLVSAELGLLLRAGREGWLRDKVAGWAWCGRHARWLLDHRRETQRLRRVPDRELARFLTPFIDPGMIGVPKAFHVLNPVMALYWSLVRKAL